MGVSGKSVKKFSEGNLAITNGVHLDSDYKHVFFDITECDDKKVKLKSHWNSTEFNCVIETDTFGEHTTIKQTSEVEKFLFHIKSKKFKVRPMKGDRIG